MIVTQEQLEEKGVRLLRGVGAFIQDAREALHEEDADPMLIVASLKIARGEINHLFDGGIKVVEGVAESLEKLTR